MSPNKVLVLDEDLFDTFFKCINIDSFSNITIDSAKVYYEKNFDKRKRNINDNWLKTHRPAIKDSPRHFPRVI